jgi:sporulation protein YlmC with PRC-barrel domain
MTYGKLDALDLFKESDKESPRSALMGANTLLGKKVSNAQDEYLGDIKEIMFDLCSGLIAYAVLANGGVLNSPEKLIAVPWNSLKFNEKATHFVLNIDKKRFDNAPRFESTNWPNMTDRVWIDSIQNHYYSHTYE